MKKIFALAIAILLGTAGRGVVAQELLVTPPGGDAANPLPQFLLPDSPSGAESFSSSAGSSTREIVNSISESEDDDGPQPYYPSEEIRVLDCNPALLESTGTWLRRGFWFAEVDAVILNRKFDKNTFILMEQITSIDQEVVSTPSTNLNAGITVNIERRNALFIGGNEPGAEGLPRVKLGRFLYRDAANRDHTAEFTAYGGGQWSQSGSLTAIPGLDIVNNTTGGIGFQDGIPDGLQVRNRLDRQNASFDGATSSQFDYDSRFHSLELNYLVKTRMKRDRMELDPSGAWIRRSQPTLTKSFLAGIRYFDLTENLNWDASGIADADADGVLETGNYLIRTDNDLIGTQLGGSIAYETSRWSLGAEVKGGGYLNRINLESDFAITGGVNQGSTRLSEDNMSFVGEFAVRGRVHLRPNLSLRTGFEVLYVNSVALAPFQADFISGGSSPIVNSGDSTYTGMSIGFEGYW